MALEPLRDLLRRLHHRTGPSGDGGLSDAHLLERFVTCRDEAAFEVLVWRHGPMVLGVCRRLLRDEHNAEDAFQATFLVLVRKAASIRKGTAVASWLYKVAYRVSLEARALAKYRAAKELSVLHDEPAQEGTDEVAWRDLRPVLDEEVQRLPEKYRAAFVLCCLQNKTNEEAAEELGCPKGTVLSRLARARERLRVRLTRRGVALSAAALASLAAGKGEAATVPVALVQLTLAAARELVAGTAAATVVSDHVSMLLKGALRAMFLTKVKMGLIVVLAIGSVVGGAIALGSWGLAGEPASSEDMPSPTTKEPSAAEPKAADKGKDVADPFKETARRLRSLRNLREIGIAMSNYVITNGALPAPAIYDKNGKALLSWRVAILPYLEQDNLYRQFKLDEPWDSPHNKQLLAVMPPPYAPVGAPTKEPNATYYQAIVGPDTAWEPGKKLTFASITDGTSNTIWVVEAASPVPWTKPEDLAYAPDKPLPKFGGLFGGNFNALFMDTQVRFIQKNADETTLRGAITRSGGEALNLDELKAPQDGTVEVDTVDLKQLPQANAQLKEAVQQTLEEVEKLKEEMHLLKLKLASGVAELDPKTAKMLKENAELKESLNRAVEQLDSLRAEKARLEKELEKRLKEKK